ncbi:hypothetical protein ABZ371_01125 [Streptomyces sp. NPDC005899]|uniref:hypothetical protein n=1 Tax=Streptomyces sp. NPDC005899 TaxID=3155716 RepID=UPI0033F7BF43
MSGTKRLKAAIVAAVAVAGLTVAVAPAQAGTCATEGGGVYICEYGITNHQLLRGEKEQFVVGSDYAVWTRRTTGGTWGGWVSIGGNVRSRVEAAHAYIGTGNDIETTLLVRGTDGNQWTAMRPALGKAWTPWRKLVDERPW